MSALLTRRSVLARGGQLAAASLGAVSWGSQAQSRKFAGVTITGATFSHGYVKSLRALIPEFEAHTGIKVELVDQAFPIYNQRTDLELSSGSDALDFCNITFIYSNRWIGAGWMTPLNSFVADRSLTPADWGADDFMPATVSHMRDAKGNIYGFPWEVGTMLMGAARADLLDAKKIPMPASIDALLDACKKTHEPAGTAAFVANNLHHYMWPPFLLGMGGKVFADPPTNVAPAFASPQGAAAADLYGQLLSKYSPRGVLSFNYDQQVAAQASGRANMSIDNVSFLIAAMRSPESKVAATYRFAPVPAGPAGSFPQVSSHGWGIPKNAKHKEAAWMFIEWAMSRATLMKLLTQFNYANVARRTSLESRQFAESLAFTKQDVPGLIKASLDRAESGYMVYRTVPVFPQVGDKLNKAIERVASGQQTGADALKQAQQEALLDIRRAGVKV